MESDIFQPQPELDTVRVRVERTIKFVSRDLMDAYKAMGGETMEAMGVDPDAPLRLGATQVLRSVAHTKGAGIFSWLAEWGMLEKEQTVVHHVKVFMDGQLVHEEDLVSGR